MMTMLALGVPMLSVRFRPHPMLIPFLVLVLGLTGAAGACAQGQPSGPDLAAPTLSAPLSSKIWDDFSLQNVSSKGHKFLGYATVTLGAAAILVKKFEGDAPGQASAAHRLLGESAALAAGATVAAGLVAHFDKLSFSGDPWTWHNLHALTAVAGASVLGSAALVGGTDIHSKLGILGTALMALAIVLEG